MNPIAPIIHKQLFQISDKVRTNKMYHEYFPQDKQFHGTITEIYPNEIPNTEIVAGGYSLALFGIKEIVIMVKVDGRMAINQDYFEKDE